MAYDINNIFARILRKEIPCKVAYEDEFTLAFHDRAPAAPTHVLVVPKGEYTSFDDFMGKATKEQIGGFFAGIHNTTKELGLVESGYRLVTNSGTNGGQGVPHFHVHILGGRQLGELLSNTRVPEQGLDTPMDYLDANNLSHVHAIAFHDVCRGRSVPQRTPYMVTVWENRHSPGHYSDHGSVDLIDWKDWLIYDSP